ncbi:MAG TPA: amino acid ABC transporter permease, partial [Bordetella sp.]
VTPTLVQLVWIYYALPILTGVQLSSFTAVLLALGLHEGAYIGEIFRAGVRSVAKGQFLAGQAIGMTYMQTMWHIILPQALKRMIPPLVNEFAALMKLTSLASVLAVPELLHAAYDIIATTFRPLEMYTVAAAVYAMVVAPFIILAHYLEHAWKERD